MSGGPGVEGGFSDDEGMTESVDRAPEGYDGGPDDSLPPTEPLGVDEPEAQADAGDPRGLTGVAARQQLLAAVGFPIRPDGVAGALTTQATRWFQESWTFSNLAVDGVWGPATEAAVRACVANGRRISAHFTLPEFACPHCHWPRANRALVRGLEVYRGKFFAVGGLGIVSAYRCAVHNAQIHGATNSQHLYGRAANVPPHGDGGRLVTVEMVAALGLFSGLEYQPKISGRGCTHVDVRAGGDPAHPAVFAWG